MSTGRGSGFGKPTLGRGSALLEMMKARAMAQPGTDAGQGSPQPSTSTSGLKSPTSPQTQEPAVSPLSQQPTSAPSLQPTSAPSLQPTSPPSQQPPLSSAESTSKPVAPVGRGRALLLNLPKPTEQTPSPRPAFVPSVGHGRATILDLMRSRPIPGEPRKSAPFPLQPGASASASGEPHASPPAPVKAHEPAAAVTEGIPPDVEHPGPSRLQKSVEPPIAHQPAPSSSGVLGPLAELSLDTKSTNSDVICKRGTSGKPTDMTTNYINLKVDPGKGMFAYEVKFNPDIDSRPLRKRLLNQHTDLLGPTKTFDGVTLYLPIKLPSNRTVVKSLHPEDNSPIELTIIFKKKQTVAENIQFFNVLIGRILRALQLVRIGRHSFNPKCAHKVEKHRLEVWPGYVTAVDEYEGGLKLCLDSVHRVVRTDTVLQFIHDLYQKSPRNFRDAVVNELVGTSVLTRYNNRTYRIDDIDWNKTPKYEFEKNDTKLSMIEYYRQHWNIIIKDADQPLLVSRIKERTTTGETQERIVLLVPEVCYLSGITDKMRSDFRVMKDIDEITRVTPEVRRNIIRRFLQEVQANELTRNLLREWGLILDDDTMPLVGRTLPCETILFAQGRTCSAGDNADWGRGATSNPMLRSPNLNTWTAIYTDKDSRICEKFINCMISNAKTMGMNINRPNAVVIRDDNTQNYLREIRANLVSNTELMVIVFPTKRNDKYAAVKKFCCVDNAVASQVIITKTITREDRMRSVAQKIALQINCKLGGALWALKMPFDNVMICGADVFHAGIGQRGQASVAAFVASMDKPLTKWFSKSCVQGKNQEIIDILESCLIASIRNYFKKNNCYPDRIILYRDGVGDGQLEMVKRYEAEQLKASFKHIKENYEPGLTIIIVQKRLNTRFFTRERQSLVNPTAGTVVDSDVTRRYYYDFFLVPQCVRQGTVSPTHYIVIYESGVTKFQPDHLQRLTFKLCHLYYNWPGTIRVPAPCQYAHKLAYLIGESVQAMPHSSLADFLYYL